MESRRIFLKSLFPRMLGWGALLSLDPSWVTPLLAHADPSSPSALNLDDPRYVSLIKDLTQRHQFAAADLKALFGKVVLQSEIIEKFERPAEILPYYEYRKRFIKNELVLRGQTYVQENLKLLQGIEEEFGVPKEIICSILGIETKFGQPGIERYRVFDILNTAYSLYPRRERFYREELIAYFLLCREEGIDPFSINGSYAGAFGVPQFMPSSFRKHAVDFDKDGKKNIWTSKEDIFASVANYLKSFGWKRNGLTYLPARFAGDSSETPKSVEIGIRKTIPLSKAVELGVQIPLPASVHKDEAVSFVRYQPEAGTEALLALFENFRSITSYNYSLNYGLVVADLSEMLTKRENS
ncbi:MAG: lytic murein transglycosylase [Candidatus Manganitrophus sp.]|nr:lytic murein transglycosylase [Candidatus Manganitrophus sp.]